MKFPPVLSRIACMLTVLFPVLIMVGSAASNGAVAVIAILFLLRSVSEKDWRWLNEPWAQCLGALWAYMILRGLFAAHPGEALRHAVPFGQYFIFAAALGAWTLRDAATRARFLSVLIAAVFFMAADGLLQMLRGADLFGNPVMPDGDGHIRLTGPFTKQYLGIMLAWLSFPVCLRLLELRTPGYTRAAAVTASVATAFLVIIVIALSGDRMALLLTCFGWAIAAFLLPLRRRYLLAALVAGSALLALIVFRFPEVYARQVTTTLHTLQHWWESPYGLLLSSDLKAAALNPVFGIGSNHFRLLCPDLYKNTQAVLTSVCNVHPHNIYLEWLIENGIIGLALYLGFLVSVGVLCVKAWRGDRANLVFIGLLVAFLLRVWPLASSTGIFSQWGTPPFWLILGALLSYCAAPRDRGIKL